MGGGGRDIAGVTFAATLVFLILQVPVWIAVAAVQIVLASPPLMVPAAIVLDSALVAAIVVWAQRRLRAAEDPEEPAAPPFVTEGTLETAVIVTVLGTIAWVRLLGLTSMEVRIAVLVVDAFAVVLMTILVLVRWALTREVRMRGVVALAASVVSAWVAWRGGGGSP